ncbi:MAG TPA: VWA domain-containing protein [Polyangiaceae bacterium]|nr:VWA domain-containing protein [Polyangiaceae bacterium]
MGGKAMRLGLGALVFLGAQAARAQGGPPGAYKVEDGSFHLKFHFQYFPTDAEIAALKEQVERARLQLCDATDAKVKISKVTLSAGQSSEEVGDVWLLNGQGRSFSELLGGHVTLFREGGAYNSATLAHELGHALLGLGDNYREENREWKNCGMGPGFDPGGATPSDNTIMQDSRTLWLLPDGRSIGDLNPFWDFGCTGGTNTCLGCPGADMGAALTCPPSQDLRSELAVHNNFDSLHGSGATACPAVKPATHLSVSAAFSGGSSALTVPWGDCGNGVTEPGEQCDPEDTLTPLPLCSSFGLAAGLADHVGCRTNCTYNKGPCAPPSFDSCSKTSGMPQACNTGPVVPGGTTCASLGLGAGSLSCHLNCSLNLQNCGTPATCGNGVLDAGEECDLGSQNATGAPVPGPSGDRRCSEFMRDTVGLLGCNQNCTLDKSACTPYCAAVASSPEACVEGPSGALVPPSSCQDHGFGIGEASCALCSLSLDDCGPAFDSSSWGAARTTANAESSFYLAVDERGERHLFRLYATRVSTDHWQVDVLGQADEYTGGIVGNTQPARTFLVDFDPITKTVSSVKSGAGPIAPGTGSLVLGGAASDGTGEGTPPFIAGSHGQAGPLTLLVDFSKVTRNPWPYFSSSTPVRNSTFFPDTLVTAGPTGTERPIARCDDPTFCSELWNDMTGDWEGVQQRWDQKYNDIARAVASPNVDLSEWEYLAKSLPFQYGLIIPPPDDRPTSTPPTVDECGGVLMPGTGWDDAPAKGLNPDGVVLVIDRSGSMKTPIDADATYGAGTGETRLAFAQAASRDFLDLVVGRTGTTPNAGLVSFSTTETLDEPLAEVLKSGVPVAGQVALDAFKGVVNALAPDGFTAIGLGLKRAGEMLNGTSLAAKTIILLSDGENNRPDPLGDADPLAVATALGKQGIRIFAVPTGHAADKILLGNIAAATGGTLFEAPIGDELPSIYAEAFALASGEQLAVPRTSITVPYTVPCGSLEVTFCVPEQRLDTAFGCVCKVDGESPIRTQAFEIEPYATQVNVLLSVRNTDVDNWSPQFRLIDPSGVVRMRESDAEVISDRFYRILTLADPEPGTWQLQLAAVDSSESQIQYVQVHVAGPGPDSYPRLSRTVVPESDPVVLSVGTSYAGRAVRGALSLVDLHRPDGSVVPLVLENTQPGGATSITIDPSNYVGRGIYRADVYTATSGTERYVLGEGALGPEPGEETNLPPAFVRRASKSFFVVSALEPPLPPGGDCDRNGLPDSEEPAGDFDGDGLPDVCDQDDDNDDIPEPGDPDPRSSTCRVPACPIADAGIDKTVQCTSPDGSALVTLDGSGSSDPDGGALSYAWTSSVPLQNADQALATGAFPLGTREATLTVSDGPNQVSDTVLVTVLDTTPPVLAPPPDVTVSTCGGTVNLGQATATDGCGGHVDIFNDAPASFPRAGKTIVTWRAVDQFGNQATATQTVVVGVGNNRNCCPVGTHIIMGTSNNDILTGTSAADCIIGLGAQDTIRGLGGNDYLSGGEGDDIIEGGDGNDQLEGGTGQDTLRGQNGDDVMLGLDGDDQCYGGIGNDRFYGGQGNDHLYGEDGDDGLFGEAGYDTLDGGNGNDILNGGDAVDTCIGGAGTNTFILCENVQ